MLRVLLLSLAACLLALAAAGEETIKRFDVTIDVQQDGDIIVTETIEVIAEGNQIRRGIFRELPRYYLIDNAASDESFTAPYQYDVRRVARDGHREPYAIETEGNAYRIRIGDADVYLEPGGHTYEIEYLVKNQIRYFDRHDELYWNVTGNYWVFPIKEASARIILPNGAKLVEQNAYTGSLGQSGHDYAFSQEGSETYLFRTTRPFSQFEGLTISLSMAKGAIAPPSLGDRGMLWWFHYGALAILVASFCGVFWFLISSFQKVGEDPPKGPVFPRYEPPEGYSPAGAHYVYYRGLRGHGALISTLIGMGVKGWVDIDASDKKSTTLTLKTDPSAKPLSEDEATLKSRLFGGRSELTLGEKYNAAFTSAYQTFRMSLSKKYASAYFRWNIGYTVVAGLMTVAAIVFAAWQAVNWTGWHTLVVLAFAGLNGVFMYLMPAPTPKGQEVRTEIEGFRLYLETAEKLQMNAVDVGSEAPPPMSVERYERFLPYAVALGVEKPWTKYFEHQLPREAEDYSPAWGRFGDRSFRNVGGMTDAITSSMNTGVSASLPQSSSSSGGGGGGSSGGGGGGGGGGGW